MRTLYIAGFFVLGLALTMTPVAGPSPPFRFSTSLIFGRTGYGPFDPTLPMILGSHPPGKALSIKRPWRIPGAQTMRAKSSRECQRSRVNARQTSPIGQKKTRPKPGPCGRLVTGPAALGRKRLAKLLESRLDAVAKRRQRLVRHLHAHLGQLGRALDHPLEAGLGEVGVELHHVLEGLGPEQRRCGLGRVLERVAGVAHHLFADGLETVGQRRIGAQHRGKILAAEIGQILIAHERRGERRGGCAVEFGGGRLGGRRLLYLGRHPCSPSVACRSVCPEMLRRTIVIWHVPAAFQIVFVRCSSRRHNHESCPPSGRGWRNRAPAKTNRGEGRTALPSVCQTVSCFAPVRSYRTSPPANFALTQEKPRQGVDGFLIS